MKAIEKAKAQKIIERIQGMDFDENDIDNLFMRLRAYSNGFRFFRETADFVAHNDARDRGLLNASLEAFYLSFKFYLEYHSSNRQLNLGEPIPLYIKKLMKYQIDKCDPEMLRADFNITPDRLKSRIDNLFKDDKKAKTTLLSGFNVGEDTFRALTYLLGFIGSVPAFTADDLMSDVVGVLKANRLDFDEAAIRAQQPAIVLCVMLLMHQSRYELSDGCFAECSINVENHSVILGLPEGANLSGYGPLQIHGVISIEQPGGPVTVAYPIFQSNLQATEHCDDSLFIVEPVEQVPGLHCRKIVLDQALVLSANARIGSAQLAE